MDSINFVYWLQGYFELSKGNKSLDEEQIKVIQDHIKLVLNKVTPERGTTVRHPLYGGDLPLTIQPIYHQPVVTNPIFPNGEKIEVTCSNAVDPNGTTTVTLTDVSNGLNVGNNVSPLIFDNLTKKY